MYASVIVDVPARQTNRPFDYRIPEAMAPWVQVGCRVGIPFGPRVLQGFVVGLEADTNQDPARIKSIAQLLDPYPTLTEELVRLGLWMGKRYVCPDIIALQAMIPSALKAKYEQWVTLRETIDSQHVVQSEWMDPIQQQLLEELKTKGKLSLEFLLQRYPSASQWIREQLQGGKLQAVQHVRDQANVKKQIMIKPMPDERSLEECLALLPSNAKRQMEIIAAVYAQKEPIPLAALLRESGASASSVKSLADKGLLMLEEQIVFRDPFAHRTFERTDPLVLTMQQQAVFQCIDLHLTPSPAGHLSPN